MSTNGVSDVINSYYEGIISDTNRSYLQSMAGCKVKFEFNNLETLKQQLSDKAINKVTIDFEIEEDGNYDSHEKLYLVREKQDGEFDYLIDYGPLAAEELNGKTYSFNITRYFVQLLTNDEYTDILYLLSSGGSANANRTILTIVKHLLKLFIRYINYVGIVGYVGGRKTSIIIKGLQRLEYGVMTTE